ncbi:MAG: helix-turn-helix domain-containing protein [Halocynthiibacter sp.]
MSTDAQDDTWYDEDIATFGDRLAGARDALGLTQEGLSRKIGVKLKTLRAWEEDTQEPRANKLQMLSGVLNVSLIWLLSGEGDGIESPESITPLSKDASILFTELRDLREEMLANAERLSQIEQKFRDLIKDQAL